ncbi:glycosyltransferase family 2 protein [Rufibacter roseolus]|uniref:glycosyltransferase family 2 protein n=1 Tax=Rufibacter roseolus TaxID=2817375 RepID=UPI001B30EDC6|nr:glycosyltransferase [Rufibacter roseolus]
MEITFQPETETKRSPQGQPQPAMPLVSVVIPCFNHGKYLQEAVESIWRQGYPATEIIVVDDGSVDNTRQVAEALPGVIYVYQENQGLSSARNTGIRHSHGEFLVFLDADDWLLPGALEMNVRLLKQDHKLAFVSGGHDKVFEEEGITKEEVTQVTANHYLHLLQGNYIGMHATVMYRRWVFEEMTYDTSLKRCEDYDLYLRIARKHPVLHHTGKIAAYRLHTTNMSGNIPGMLSTTLDVLDRQQTCLKTHQEKEAFSRGHEIWKEYYCDELYKSLITGKAPASVKATRTLLQYRPILLLKFIVKSLVS